MSKHRRPGDRRRRLALAAAVVAAVTLLSASSPALAAKGGGGGKPSSGGGKHNTVAPTGSFTVVPLDSTDGQLHWGQRITFDVTSTATYYFVNVTCSQAGSVVFQQSTGFYPGWAWSTEFTLKSAAWVSGAADCAARLYSSYSDGTNEQTLATMTFPVAA
jgi:hypothetical protein